MTHALSAVAAAVGLSLLLGGCAASGVASEAASSGRAPSNTAPKVGPPGSDTAAGTTASGTQPGTPPGAIPTPSTSTPSASTSSGWKTFTTSDGLSFDYPADWSARDPGGALGGAFVDVTNAAGEPMAQLRTNIVTGAECVEQYPYQVFDSQPLQALTEPGVADRAVPRYVFESRGDGTEPGPTQSTTARYGITMMAEEPGPLACPMFHLFLWPPSGALFGSTYDPAHNHTPGDPALPYLEKAKLYKDTGEYQEIRKMITSLRPAKAAG